MSNATVASASAADTSGIFAYLMEGYWDQYGDPRVRPWFLMSSMRPLVTILSLYLAFVLVIGPRMMKNRKPFSLKPILIVYNLAMSIANAYFFYRVVFVDYNYGMDMFNLKFPSFDDTSAPIMSKIQVGDLYLISKLIDLCDTIFFVLRKKQSQITGLHVYHHFSVPLFGWIHFRLCGTNACVIPFGLINSLIHTLMYGYYGLAALGPHMQPYLWWKRYITQIQIAQFVFLFIYAVYFTTLQQGYHVFFALNAVIQSVMYLYLFSSFYLSTYKKKPQLKSESAPALEPVKKEL